MFSHAETLGVVLLDASIDAANPSAVTLEFEAGKLTDEMRRAFRGVAALSGIGLTIVE